MQEDYRSISSDDVQKSLDVLDQVLSEFDDTDTISVCAEVEDAAKEELARPTATASKAASVEREAILHLGGHQSEDDGYMSMNGRKSRMKLTSFSSSVSQESTSEGSTSPAMGMASHETSLENSDFPPPPEEAERLISTLLPRVTAAKGSKRILQDGRELLSNITAVSLDEIVGLDQRSTTATQTTLPMTKHLRPFGWQNDAQPNGINFERKTTNRCGTHERQNGDVSSFFETLREEDGANFSEDSLEEEDEEEEGEKEVDTRSSSDASQVVSRASVAWQVLLVDDDDAARNNLKTSNPRPRPKLPTRSASYPTTPVDDWPELASLTSDCTQTEEASEVPVCEKNTNGKGTYVIRKQRRSRNNSEATPRAYTHSRSEEAVAVDLDSTSTSASDTCEQLKRHSSTFDAIKTLLEEGLVDGLDDTPPDFQPPTPPLNCDESSGNASPLGSLGKRSVGAQVSADFSSLNEEIMGRAEQFSGDCPDASRENIYAETRSGLTDDEINVESSQNSDVSCDETYARYGCCVAKGNEERHKMGSVRLGANIMADSIRLSKRKMELARSNSSGKSFNCHSRSLVGHSGSSHIADSSVRYRDNVSRVNITNDHRDIVPKNSPKRPDYRNISRIPRPNYESKRNAAENANNRQNESDAKGNCNISKVSIERENVYVVPVCKMERGNKIQMDSDLESVGSSPVTRIRRMDNGRERSDEKYEQEARRRWHRCESIRSSLREKQFFPYSNDSECESIESSQKEKPHFSGGKQRFASVGDSNYDYTVSWHRRKQLFAKNDDHSNCKSIESSLLENPYFGDFDTTPEKEREIQRPKNGAYANKNRGDERIEDSPMRERKRNLKLAIAKEENTTNPWLSVGEIGETKHIPKIDVTVIENNVAAATFPTNQTSQGAHFKVKVEVQREFGPLPPSPVEEVEEENSDEALPPKKSEFPNPNPNNRIYEKRRTDIYSSNSKRRFKNDGHPPRDPNTSLKSRSVDAQFARNCRNQTSSTYHDMSVERKTLPTDPLGTSQRRRQFRQRVGHFSAQDIDGKLPANGPGSLPETPMFTRGCDIARVATPDINGSGSIRSSTRLGLAHNGLSPGICLGEAIAGTELLRMAGPGRGWYPRQRHNRPVSVEHLDRLVPAPVSGLSPSTPSTSAWQNSRDVKKPQTLPPNLSPKFFQRSPREALRRVTSLLIRRGQNNKDSKSKNVLSSSVMGAHGELEETSRSQKRGFFRSFWKRSRHYSLDSQP